MVAGRISWAGESLFQNRLFASTFSGVNGSKTHKMTFPVCIEHVYYLECTHAWRAWRKPYLQLLLKKGQSMFSASPLLFLHSTRANAFYAFCPEQYKNKFISGRRVYNCYRSEIRSVEVVRSGCVLPPGGEKTIIQTKSWLCDVIFICCGVCMLEIIEREICVKMVLMCLM